MTSDNAGTVVFMEPSFANDHPGYRIDTEEQARNWVLELVADVELARAECNVVFPDNRARTVEHQRKAYRRFMVKHGGVLGVLMALYRCGKLGDVAYRELRQRALNTLAC